MAYLEEELGRCYADPLRFVLWAFPFGQSPDMSIVPLAEPWASRFPNCKYGPDKWACEVLDEIGRQVRAHHFDGAKAVAPIQFAMASGHGVGKSCLTAWLVAWIMATRPGAKGAVTANTADQLKTKTWAEISRWIKRSLVADMFDIGTVSIAAKESPESWRVDALTCREENSESFAGQHAASSTSFYIFDEASAVPDIIWEVAKGGLTDGEPMFFAFGNPTRNTGAFKECFTKNKKDWITKNLDSRDAFITNKQQIEKWKEEYGEDSDFFRVRVRGLFPAQSSRQFISIESVEQAMRRQPPRFSASLAVVGVDVARYGDDDTVIATRVGRDATFPLKRFHGLNTVQVVGRVKAHINELYRKGFKHVRCFVDEGGVGGGPVDLLKEDGFPVRGVNFGSAADDPTQWSRKREEMWGRMREWLKDGSLVDDGALADDLTSPEFDVNLNGSIKLERKEDMKKRGLSSPDAADALALTFAYRLQEYDDIGPSFQGATGRRNFDPTGIIGRVS